ncbi:EamA family transporter [Rhodohalobacter sulfatireducens]|uniref:EamA family transporter n=1 Tax=Rhodohalobacter sulfatireducens TaxID=2911366 RepID=A0ABS9KF15_9BACT|nr:EamA family transporter [Rhodohalobacter sulfatireducens]MCG2589431.1 EamA family transporter [Rhodohalobacter sulfatireducens]
MMAGWIYIVLSTISSVLIAHFFKISEGRKLNTIRVITVNYLIAFPSAFLLYGSQDRADVLLNEMVVPVLMAVVVGVVFIFNFFIYSKSVNLNGVGISIAAMRISLIVPVMISTIWYLELLTLNQWFGLLLVFVVLYLLLPNKKSLLKGSLSAGWLLPLLFLCTGIGDGSLKIYESEFNQILSKGEFMGLVFLTAFLVGVITVIYKRKWQFKKMEIFIGACIGIPNMLSAVFVIEALERMNGAVVYSLVNVLSVIGGTFLGVVFWGDRFTKMQWLGIVLTISSILLLL